ncbi:MAG: antA/AntB antirepressor family protein [Bacteroidales bacterium]|nr:antA/AntB antirepressor family protein [Bacteroidales bacterium]
MANKTPELQSRCAEELITKQNERTTDMKEMIRSRGPTAGENALAVDADGHTTARKLYEWLELSPGNYMRWVKQNITGNVFAEEGKDYMPLASRRSEQGGRW